MYLIYCRHRQDGGWTMSWLTGLRDLLRGIDSLMQIEQKHGKAIEELKNR